MVSTWTDDRLGTLWDVGRGTALQARRSLTFFQWLNPSSLTMALESTQPQTKISTFDLPFILLFYVRILVSEKIFGPHKGKQCEVTFVSHSHLQFLRHQRLLSLEPLCTNILCYVSPVAACLYSSYTCLHACIFCSLQTCVFHFAHMWSRHDISNISEGRNL